MTGESNQGVAGRLNGWPRTGLHLGPTSSRVKPSMESRGWAPGPPDARPPQLAAEDARITLTCISTNSSAAA